VNCSFDAGAVFLYDRDAFGTWGNTPVYIKAPNPAGYHNFGYVSLSGDGDTLAVGSYRENTASQGVGGSLTYDCNAVPPDNCAIDSGAVYLY
jgi:hypothetical protein